jgi:hypothetical protein
VLERNRRTPCSLRGGAFCASFERAPDGEPWVQVKTGVLNIFYPGDEEPIPNLRARVPLLPADATCPSWEPWKYATVEFESDNAQAAATLVEDLFLRFYDYPDLDSEIIDMRDGT